MTTSFHIRQSLIRTFLVVSFVVVGNNAVAQQDIDEFLRKEKCTPPGTSFIGDGVYMDDSEILNIHWLEFVHYLEKDSSYSYYKSMLPDTASAWRAMGDRSVVIDYVIDSAAQSSFLDRYFRYPGRRFYPVIGVSFFQAQEYCKWRSKAVDQTMNERLAKSGKNYSLRYTYYLPSLDEYQICLDFDEVRSRKMDGKSKRLIKSITTGFNPKKDYYHLAVKQDIALTTEGLPIYKPGFNWITYSYGSPPMKKNIHHIIGNVSEMTSTEGISFGGSWIHTMDEIKKDVTFEYTKPEYWLGFRCACKVEVVKH